MKEHQFVKMLRYHKKTLRKYEMAMRVCYVNKDSDRQTRLLQRDRKEQENEHKVRSQPGRRRLKCKQHA